MGVTKSDVEVGHVAAVGASSPSAAGDALAKRPLILEVKGLYKCFGSFVALDRISINARRGEFLTVLGESGSGKTTLLRIIGGLEQPTSIDSLLIGGQEVGHVPAHRRNVTTVFQHYGLFPHMTVGENVEYGLRVRGVARNSRRHKAAAMLETVRLPDRYGSKIHELSGGERQRVALARALVTSPEILLLDEPLGALDERLRIDMQVELQQLQRRLGTTFVYITHSQEEALTMSDRVVLMRRGSVAQEGQPRDLFERPQSRFVAEFMGVENILDGDLDRLADGVAHVRLGSHIVKGRWSGVEQPERGAAVAAAVRADKVRPADGPPLEKEAQEENLFVCRPLTLVYKGKYADLTVESDIGALKARLWDPSASVPATRYLCWRTRDCAVVPRQDRIL